MSSVAQRQAVVSGQPANSAPGWLPFADYLLRQGVLTGDLLDKTAPTGRPDRRRLRELWELTDLSANDFADEVAHFFKLPRLGLPQLLAASSLAPKFSARFLREMTAFPCHLNTAAANTLVVADPTDAAVMRAAEIVLGGPVAIAVASFEDIATVLSKRLGDDEALVAEDGEPATIHAEADIESLRDLASGAPVVRAVNDLLEKAAELRATDIHVEPVRSRL